MLSEKKYRLAGNRFYKIYVVFLLLFLNPIFPQDAQVTNVSFELIKNDVYIYYDLTGEADAEYEVTILLRRESISGYIFPLRTVRGDVGKGKFVGEKRTIIWDVFKDFHIDEEVTDYYFEVTAEKVGGIPWYYYVGGGLVAGAAAALIIASGSEEQTETRTAIKPPPVRP
jgi:hypothetical protein